MADTETREIQVKEKQEAAAAAEQTKPGLVFIPEVDIFETEKSITLLADMPGVKAKDLCIDLRENILSLSGDVAPFEGPDENDVFIEYEIGKYTRQFTLSEVIDQGHIDARMQDGVLRLTLPKVEKAAPKKIEVKAS